MKVIVIIECDTCCTLEETELNTGKNIIHSCKCGNYYGDEGGIVTVEIDK